MCVSLAPKKKFFFSFLLENQEYNIWSAAEFFPFPLFLIFFSSPFPKADSRVENRNTCSRRSGLRTGIIVDVQHLRDRAGGGGGGPSLFLSFFGRPRSHATRATRGVTSHGERDTRCGIRRANHQALAKNFSKSSVLLISHVYALVVLARFFSMRHLS